MSSAEWPHVLTSYLTAQCNSRRSSQKSEGAARKLSCIPLSPWGPRPLVKSSLARETISLGLTQPTFDVVSGVISPTARQLLTEDEKHETRIKVLIKRVFCWGVGVYWTLSNS